MAAKVCVYRGVVSKNIRVYLPTGQKKTANKIGQWSWQWLVWDGPLWFFRISLKESFYWSTKSRIFFVAQQNSGRKNVLKDLNIVSFLHPRGVPPILYYFFWWDLPSISCLRSFWYLLGDSWFLDGLFVGFLMDYVDWFVWTAKKVTHKIYVGILFGCPIWSMKNRRVTTRNLIDLVSTPTWVLENWPELLRPHRQHRSRTELRILNRNPDKNWCSHRFVCSVSNMDTCSVFFQSNLQNVEVVLGKKHVFHVSNKFICK